MTGTYPVLLDGKHKGTLRVTQEGLNTIFEIRCEHPGRVVRLSVYGGGREGYLGVPAPEGGSPGPPPPAEPGRYGRVSGEN